MTQARSFGLWSRFHSRVRPGLSLGLSSDLSFGHIAMLTLLAALFMLVPEAGFAQDAGAVLDDAILAMKSALDTVGRRLVDIARNALLSLLVVDFVLRAGRGIFGNESIPDLMRGFAFQLGFVSCIWLLIATVPEIVPFLAEQALDIARLAGAAETEPGNMVTQGLTRASSWLGEIRLAKPGTWFYLIAIAISIITMAMAVAMTVVIYAELYLSGMAGLITLMFAGLTETRDKALGFVNMLVGKAFKLMGLMIIVATTGEMTSALAQNSGSGYANAMGMITLQIVSVILILTLPNTLEGLVGSKFSTRAAEVVGKMVGGAMKAAGAVGLGAAAGAATGAVSGGISGAKAGTGLLKGAGAGARDRGIDWGRAIHNKDVKAAIGRKVAQRIGYRGAGGGS